MPRKAGSALIGASCIGFDGVLSDTRTACVSIAFRLDVRHLRVRNVELTDGLRTRIRLTRRVW
jgi:hypothetical protein